MSSSPTRETTTFWIALDWKLANQLDQELTEKYSAGIILFGGVVHLYLTVSKPLENHWTAVVAATHTLEDYKRQLRALCRIYNWRIDHLILLARGGIEDTYSCRIFLNRLARRFPRRSQNHWMIVEGSSYRRVEFPQFHYFGPCFGDSRQFPDGFGFQKVKDVANHFHQQVSCPDSS